MLKTSLRWLKNSHPFELEFEGCSEGGVCTRTGTSTDSSVARRYQSPKELVAVGIAGCTGIDVLSILAKMRQPLDDLEIETELSQTQDHPRVFDSCWLTYRFEGKQLINDRVLRAVALSYAKYCGVSAMIKKSGCVFFPKVIINGADVTPEFETVLEVIENDPEKGEQKKPTAGLLISGNEIVSGKTSDTNGTFLIKKMTHLGIGVREVLFLGDSKAALEDALKRMCSCYDYVVMTGGLGPTKDDLTRETVSEVFRVPLIFSESAWEVCKNAFLSMGRTDIPESNRKQGFIPQGAEVLSNAYGTACGFQVSGRFDGHKNTLFALPGVPWECEEMFSSQVSVRLPNASLQKSAWGPWHVWGIGESALQSGLCDWETEVLSKVPDVNFSYQAHAGFISYGFSRSNDEVTEQDALSETFLSGQSESLRALLGEKILFSGTQSLLERLSANFKLLKLSLSGAESCTGGRIAAELTSLPGISAVFLGSVVAYSNKSKVELLRVSEETLEKCGTVSSETAAQMAAGVCAQFSSSIGFSVTGIAGPEGGSELKPVGTVCFGLSIHSSCLRDLSPEMLLRKLKLQGWLKAEFSEGGQYVCFVAMRNFGSHLSREIIQRRSAAFVLCSLVALTETLILLEKDGSCTV
ncbi:MAG: hypothetical protein RIR26_1520 [Pseudomonadota bacterium]|jgi:nicotinamide-nucleotide amidase